MYIQNINININININTKIISDLSPFLIKNSDENSFFVNLARKNVCCNCFLFEWIKPKSILVTFHDIHLNFNQF